MIVYSKININIFLLYVFSRPYQLNDCQICWQNVERCSLDHLLPSYCPVNQFAFARFRELFTFYRRDRPWTVFGHYVWGFFLISNCLIVSLVFCLFVLSSAPDCPRDRHSSYGDGLHWLWRRPSLHPPWPRRKQSHPDAVELCCQKHFRNNSSLSTTVGCIYWRSCSGGQNLFKKLFWTWFFRGHPRGSDHWWGSVHLQPQCLPQWFY